MKRAQRFLKYVLFAFVCFSAFAFLVSAEDLSDYNSSRKVSYGKTVSYYNTVTIDGVPASQKWLYGLINYRFDVTCSVISGDSKYISIYNDERAYYPDYNWTLRVTNRNNSGKTQNFVVNCVTSQYLSASLKADTIEYYFTFPSSTSVIQNEFKNVMITGDVIDWALEKY